MAGIWEVLPALCIVTTVYWYNLLAKCILLAIMLAFCLLYNWHIPKFNMCTCILALKLSSHVTLLFLVSSYTIYVQNVSLLNFGTFTQLAMLVIRMYIEIYSNITLPI